MNLALFDFDGTITTKDSYLLFTRFIGSRPFFLDCLMLSPRILCFLFGLYPNSALKEDFLHYFYKNKSLADLRRLADHFCAETIPATLRPQAVERLRWHQKQGDTVSVVSATPRLILEPWCRNNGVNLIATEIEINSDGRITGRIVGANCRGQEKVRRIISNYDLSSYRDVYAYGDSEGDLPMLELASKNNRFYKPFR